MFWPLVKTCFVKLVTFSLSVKLMIDCVNAPTVQYCLCKQTDATLWSLFQASSTVHSTEMFLKSTFGTRKKLKTKTFLLPRKIFAIGTPLNKFQDDIEFLKKNTRYDETEIREWYK